MLQNGDTPAARLFIENMQLNKKVNEKSAFLEMRVSK